MSTMFKKVLVAEDIDSINIGLMATLNEEFDFEIHHAKYCDEAYLKIKRALQDNDPYDLLITDLSFKQDHRICTIASGEELVEKVFESTRNIKVMMYSIEDRLQKIQGFFDRTGIDGYVCKGRNSAKEIKEAIYAISKNENYISPDLEYALKGIPVLEIEDYDILLINELAEGLSQEEISEKFKNKGISPSSLSSIEKRINKLKIYFKAKNATHLVSIVKDLGLI